MAISTEACERMIEASERTDKQLMIGQTLRFFPSYQYVKEAIDSERYGKVVGFFLPWWDNTNLVMGELVITKR